MQTYSRTGVDGKILDSAVTEIEYNELTISVDYYGLHPGEEVEKELIFSYSITRDELLIDKPSGQGIAGVHLLIGVYPGEESGTADVVDVLKATNPTKAGAPFMAGRIYNLPSQGNMGVYFLLPTSESPTSDWIVVAPGSFVVNGTAVDSPKFNPYENPTSLICAYTDLLPSISISYSDGVVSAQLTDSAGQPMAYEGAEIYLETTTGQLAQNRIYTDSSGAGSTALANAVAGKVKAGFKYFSGKAEVAI
jgi:hypothetical protein